MKYIKVLEEYSYERIQKRKIDEFNNLGPIVKKRKYDANFIIKRLKKEYPHENFYITDYYTAEIKVAFLSSDSNKINAWNRDSDNYDDGLKKDFANWLKTNDLTWSWRTSSFGGSWDGIYITPTDYDGLELYYKGKLIDRKIKVREDKSSLYKIIDEFKKQGFDVYEPDGVEENDKKSSGRDIVEINKHNMIFRFYIMRGSNIKKEVKESINKYKESTERHLLVIKETYKYCETITEGPLWTMCGGGTQLQQFYGDDNGYLCILYLDMEKEPSKDPIKNIRFQINNEEKNSKKFSKFNLKRVLKKPEVVKYYEIQNDIRKYNI